MQKVKWGVLTLLAILIVTVLHYSLPQRDIVRIVGTDVKRMDIGSRGWFWAEPDSLTEQERNRDVRFINAVFPDGDPFVYRNEDTNWSYPPYLKFDSGSITAQAQALTSTHNDPIWVVITHYGWRFELLTMYPNVVGIRKADDPEETLIPWFNIVLLSVLGYLVFLVYRFIVRLRERHIDPLQKDVEAAFDDLADSSRQTANDVRFRWRRWLSAWRPRKKRGGN